ncbi:hypothetical protein PIB30_025270 [Stylosanthes scabra]|uniref:Uncharacterized protein n=1 Tax=Stylosanthes scabra TaxID=79078 RepID=A0ABU6TAU2_9FABA|nr:hypothetical protein [Stylosanthes scabra]
METLLLLGLGVPPSNHALRRQPYNEESWTEIMKIETVTTQPNFSPPPPLQAMLSGRCRLGLRCHRFGGTAGGCRNPNIRLGIAATASPFPRRHVASVIACQNFSLSSCNSCAFLDRVKLLLPARLSSANGGVNLRLEPSLLEGPPSVTSPVEPWQKLVLLEGAKLQHVIATLALENAGITGYLSGTNFYCNLRLLVVLYS